MDDSIGLSEGECVGDIATSANHLELSIMATIRASTFQLQIKGTATNNRIYGNKFNNKIYGLAGHDRLYGEAHKFYY